MSTMAEMWPAEMPEHLDDETRSLSVTAAETARTLKQIEVVDAPSLAYAAEQLGAIAKLRKNLEEKRKWLTKPLNDHVKRINDLFKSWSEPLDHAEGGLKAKISTYQMEAERRRREEEARIRREQEEAARKLREEQERVRRENEARERAHREEQDRIRRANEEAVTVAAAADEYPPEEIEEPSAPVIEPEPVASPIMFAPLPMERKSVHTSQGTVTAKSVWEFEIVSPTQIPRDYLQIDEAAIRAAVRRGVRDIAGVRIFETKQISVR